MGGNQRCEILAQEKRQDLVLKGKICGARVGKSFPKGGRLGRERFEEPKGGGKRGGEDGGEALGGPLDKGAFGRENQRIEEGPKGKSFSND